MLPLWCLQVVYLLRFVGMSGNPVPPCVVQVHLWWQWHPPVGILVALLGVIGVLVPWLRDPKHKHERAFWAFAMIALTAVELWSIRRDQIERNEAQTAALCGEKQQFQGVLSGLQSGIETSRQQYASTIQQVNSALLQARGLSRSARNALYAVTGGDSFASITPQVGLDQKPIPFSIHNSGSYPLTSVTVTVRKGVTGPEGDRLLPQNTVSNAVGQISVGTLSPRQLRILPDNFQITPDLGTRNLDTYELDIAAQNFTFHEHLQFRGGTHHPYAFKETVYRIEDIHTRSGATRYRPIILLDCPWSEGAPCEAKPGHLRVSHSIRHRARVHGRNIKKVSSKSSRAARRKRRKAERS
jgi:hypothetical protein